MKPLNGWLSHRIPWSEDLRTIVNTLIVQTGDALPEIPRILLWALSLYRVSPRVSYDVFVDVWVRLQNTHVSDKGSLTTYASALVRFRTANAVYHYRSAYWPVRVSQDDVRALVKSHYGGQEPWAPDSLHRRGYSKAHITKLTATAQAVRPHTPPTVLECGEDVSTVDRIMWDESKETLHAHVARLPQRTRVIIGSYFQLPGHYAMTVDELSACYKVSHQRIYQIIDATLEKLRAELPAGIEETVLNRPATPREQRKQPRARYLYERLSTAGRRCRR